MRESKVFKVGDWVRDFEDEGTPATAYKVLEVSDGPEGWGQMLKLDTEDFDGLVQADNFDLSRKPRPATVAKAKRPGYREAVEWIALNDETGETDVEAMSGLISIAMVADLWGKDSMTVAKAVIAKRKRAAKGQ